MKSDTHLFISREPAWLEFNNRVLEEACDKSKTAAERLRFIIITENNLDEFFMVRAAGLRQLVRGGHDYPDPAGLRPSQRLEKMRQMILDFSRRRRLCLEQEILPELEKQGLFLRSFSELSDFLKERVCRCFEEHIKPVLTPRIIDEVQPFPLLAGGALEIACRLELPGGAGGYALVEVPEILERFYPFEEKGETIVLALEEIICAFLPSLFDSCRIREHLLFRMTRDMDFSLEDDSVQDLLESLSHQLELRQKRGAVRLEISGACRGELFGMLCRKMELEPLFVYETAGLLNLKGLESLISLAGPPVCSGAFPVSPRGLPEHLPVLEALKKEGTVMIAPPYQKFSPLVRLLEEAAEDPCVLAVKQTLYRVSGNSPVVHALERAAENGKQVTVIVELKARFDEKNNIAWARALEEAGAHVVYGLPGLKIHGKALLIVRREEPGILQRYVHLSTGNYNDKTAQIYTDIGLLSTDRELCTDVEKFFNAVTGYTARGGSWQKISAAPFDLRQKLTQLIENEIAFVRAGKKGLIRAKMNSLSDRKVIRLLHRAADAGVELQLLVRGICCFKPGKHQKNVRIISIVDRFLEHSRIFHFANGGDDLYYLSSADWMTRNLDRRVEILFPVEPPELKRALDRILALHFADDCKSRQLGSSGRYTAPSCAGTCRSQKKIQELFQTGNIYL